MDNSPRDRTTAIAWARSIMDDRRAVFLDTETTGLGKSAEIVDLAVVDVSGEILIDTLVRPSIRIPPEATAIHRIRDADVVHAPGWRDIAAEMYALLSERIVVVYNANFDRAMIWQCCERWGTAWCESDWRCAMRAYAAYRSQWLAGKQRPRWYKLPDAALSFGIAPGGHRARADAEVCRAVVAAMANG